MKLAIFDPFNHSPGLSILFPESHYFVYEPDSYIHFKATRHMNNTEFNKVYGFHYKSDWSSINSINYDTLFIVLPLLDCQPLNAWHSKPDAIKVWILIAEILKNNNFKKVCLFDTYDYDYDPSIIFPETHIDYFFKRNMNKNKVYASNVIPFTFIIFTVPCPLFMCLTYNRDIYNNTRKNAIFWAGGIYKHEATHTIHNITYNVIRDRESIYKQLYPQLNVISNLSHGSFLMEISNSKYALDLEGVGDPNARTFEILIAGSLRLHNNTEVIWPFEHKFSKLTEFRSLDEFNSNLNLLNSDPHVYDEALNNQNNIFKMYFNKEWLSSYIIKCGHLELI